MELARVQGADAVKKMFEQDDTVEGTWMKVPARRLGPALLACACGAACRAWEQQRVEPATRLFQRRHRRLGRRARSVPWHVPGR